MYTLLLRFLSIYRKQWNKLSVFHKIVKLKEFIQQNYGEGDFQNELITKLSTYAQEGKINTKKVPRTTKKKLRLLKSLIKTKTEIRVIIM